jgi:hypothetical protein
MDGRFPRGPCVKRLTELPILWSEQWSVLGLQEPIQAQAIRLINADTFRSCNSSSPSIGNRRSAIHSIDGRETDFSRLRLVGGFGRGTQEDGLALVRRPGRSSLTAGNCLDFCRPGNRVGFPGPGGGGRSLAKPVSPAAKFPANREKNREFSGFKRFRRKGSRIMAVISDSCERIPS